MKPRKRSAPISVSQKHLTEIFQRKKYEKKRKRMISYYKRMISYYKAQGCRTCPKQKLCTQNKKEGIRYIKSTENQQQRKEMIEKMQTEKAKQVYALRKQTVEPAFGDIKQNKGLTTFLTRNLKTVKTEFNLICTASNIKKIWIQKQNKKHSTQKTKTTPQTQPNIFAKLTQIRFTQ